MYCICGTESDVFINFMMNVFLFNGYNIPFLPLSYHLQMGRTTVAPWVASRTTMTMWLKVSNLFCSVPYSDKTI